MSFKFKIIIANMLNSSSATFGGTVIGDHHHPIERQIFSAAFSTLDATETRKKR
jgi:hypothetical protein